MGKMLLILFFTVLNLLIKCTDRIDRNTEKRAKTLEHLIEIFSSDQDAMPQEFPVWESWLKRTGELPPDFEQLPTFALPPPLLRFNDGEPVTDSRQWEERKLEIRKVLDRYMFGNWPPPPEKILIKYSPEIIEDNEVYTKKNVQLWFAPSVKAVEFADIWRGYNQLDYSTFLVANLNVELYIPKGIGPFPAIIELGPSGDRISMQDMERLKRGYIVVRFNRKDADFIPAIYVDYECNQLEWWAYAAGRCVDLLYSLDEVDTTKIVVAGHSRGGKTALLAALMDERVDAVINSHPGTGAGSYNLWRYAGEKYGGENLENSTRRFPYWNNPRMRFFIGRENKMPFDSHFLLSLLAPRPVLLGTGERDHVGQAWGDQQCYLIVKEVYRLLGHEQNLGFYASPGAHQVTSEMTQDHLDWLDMQFGRKPFTFTGELIYTYTFDEWKEITGEELNKDEFPEKDLTDILLAEDGRLISEIKDWEIKSQNLKKRILQIMGDLPAYEKIEEAVMERERRFSGDLVKAEIQIDDKLLAHVTYPADRTDKMPVVIYLHAYLDAGGHNWSRGYGYWTSVGERMAQNGFMAVEFDLFGYASRNRDSGIEFYRENPDVSALGVMIQDVRKIIDALGFIDWVDHDRIMVAGYSLGGMVGLYSAVFDDRIKAVASTCGFGSMRLDSHGMQTEGIRRYSHLRPTIPRLGLFLGNERRIPYDFHEVLALIAPRPVMILAPMLDQDWFYEDVEICYIEASKIYDLYGKRDNIVMQSPNDFNRYTPEYQKMVNEWFTNIK